MISNHAHQLNKDKRKELEGLGYKFSIGHDGWGIFYQGEAIDSGVGKVRTDRGEDTHRHYMDVAVGAALNHYRKVPKEANMPEEVTRRVAATRAEVAPPAPAPAELTRLQTKMVESAINMLTKAGALYTIIAGTEEFSNMLKVPRAPRVSFAPIYGPLLYPFKGKGPFTTTLACPEGVDWTIYVQAVRRYLHATYGPSSHATETNPTARTLEVLVHDAPFDEE